MEVDRPAPGPGTDPGAGQEPPSSSAGASTSSAHTGGRPDRTQGTGGGGGGGSSQGPPLTLVPEPERLTMLAASGAACPAAWTWRIAGGWAGACGCCRGTASCSDMSQQGQGAVLCSPGITQRSKGRPRPQHGVRRGRRSSSSGPPPPNLPSSPTPTAALAKRPPGSPWAVVFEPSLLLPASSCLQASAAALWRCPRLTPRPCWTCCGRCWRPRPPLWCTRPGRGRWPRPSRTCRRPARPCCCSCRRAGCAPTRCVRCPMCRATHVCIRT